MRKFRIRKSLFGKCILQEWRSFPQSVPGAPSPYWEEVEWKTSPYGMQCFGLTIRSNQEDPEAKEPKA